MTIARGPMPVMEEPERIRDELQRRRPDTLGSPVNVGKAASPMFGREDRQPPFQKTSVECRVVGDDEHNFSQQVVHSSIVDAVAGDHLFGNPGEAGDFRRDWNSGGLQANSTSRSADRSARRFDHTRTHTWQARDLVVLGIGAGGLDIDDGSHELWIVVGRVVFGSRL